MGLFMGGSERLPCLSHCLRVTMKADPKISMDILRNLFATLAKFQEEQKDQLG